jgi:hypothetical protein
LAKTKAKAITQNTNTNDPNTNTNDPNTNTNDPNTNTNDNATTKVLNNANIWYLSGFAMLPIAFCYNYKAALIAIPCMYMGDIYMEAYDRIKNEGKRTHNSE